MSNFLFEVEEYPLQKLTKFVSKESNEKNIFMKTFNSKTKIFFNISALRCKNEEESFKSLLNINEWDFSISEDGNDIFILKEEDLIVKSIQNDSLKTTITFKRKNLQKKKN